MVVLQNSVRVYKFAKPPNLQSAYETANNPWGLCCLSPKRLAFPGRTVGHVQLVEIATGNVSIIPAHSSAIKAVQLSSDGELLATASEKVGLSQHAPGLVHHAHTIGRGLSSVSSRRATAPA